MSTLKRKKQRIAVIGTGLAGLTAAHLLAERNGSGETGVLEHLEIHVFEKSGKIGMDAAGMDVVGNDGKRHRVDSPMRAVQGGYYKRLLLLYKSLGVELVKSNFTYSFSQLSERPTRDYAFSCSSEKKPSHDTTFIYNGGNGLSLRPFSFPSSLSTSSSSPHTQSSPIPYLSHLQHLLRVLIFALSYLYLLLLSFYHVLLSHTSPSSTHWISSSTLSLFLSRTYLPSSFTEELLIPLLACVATISPQELADYPVAELLEYIVHTFGTDHYLVSGGIQNVVSRLLARIPRQCIHLNCELVSIRRSVVDKTMIELEDGEGNRWEVENVIIATQANQAQKLMRMYYKSLQDEPEKDERLVEYERRRIEMLGKFEYTRSRVVNHYDAKSTLVRQRGDRRTLNLASWRNGNRHHGTTLGAEKTSDEKHALLGNERNHIMATHDLSILHPALCIPSSHPETDPQPLLQTTNPTVPIDPSLIISEQTFERAKVTLQSREALSGFLDPSSNNEDGREGERSGKNMQGRGGIWFVGAWAAEGIPLLEGCVVSAERVCEAILAGM